MFRSGIYVLTSLLVGTYLAPAASASPGCETQIKATVKHCNDIASTMISADDINSEEGAAIAKLMNVGPNQGSQIFQSVSVAGQSNTNLTNAADQCTTDKKQCKNASCDAVKDKEIIAACEKALTSVAQKLTEMAAAAGRTADQAGDVAKVTGAQPQSTNPLSGGDSGGGMGSSMGQMMPLLATGLGVAAGMYMAKKQQAATAQSAASANSIPGMALQANGSLDCSQADSYGYPDCATYLETACATGTATVNTAATATAGTGTPNCAAFNSNFCTSQITAAVPTQSTLADGSIAQLNVGGSGGGFGSPYCMKAQAAAYCSNPGYASMRQGCPSCRQLATSQSSTCLVNPAACMAQNSATQIASAQSQCSDDPIFSNPGSPFLQGGGAAFLNNGTNLQPAGSTISTTLPQSIGSRSRRAATSATGGGAISGTTNLMARTPANATLGTAAPQAVNAGNSGRAQMQSLSGPSGGPQGYRTASARAPASDVQAQYSQSLFTTSTSVLQQRCQAGKLNNCP